MQLPRIDHYQTLIALARSEDLGSGDITSEVTVPEHLICRAAIVFRQQGVLCGMPVVEQVLAAYDGRMRLEDAMADGEAVLSGQRAGLIVGPLRSVLAAERVVLNFLQRLSAIATQTTRYVEAVKHTSAVICDTRKTTPGWRELEKYAVRCGGGTNHRYGLFDAVLIKDNHLAALGAANLRQGLIEAIRRIAKARRKPSFVQVEVDTLEQLEIVLGIDGIDIILLDNMSCEQLAQAAAMRHALNRTGRKVLLEASGGVTLANVAAIAETGIDRISIGALTHAVSNLDIGLDLEESHE